MRTYTVILAMVISLLGLTNAISFEELTSSLNSVGRDARHHPLVLARKMDNVEEIQNFQDLFDFMKGWDDLKDIMLPKLQQCEREAPLFPKAWVFIDMYEQLKVFIKTEDFDILNDFDKVLKKIEIFIQQEFKKLW